ncbi:MAG: hypothetical protein EA426_10535 [Spirochaetaceae bacterium]|nr:MAG: hypothetical protein EA426_10535 [Spirochaetaceae bacterium]
MFGFPFMFLFPLMIGVFAIRAGMHFFREVDRRNSRYAEDEFRRGFHPELGAQVPGRPGMQGRIFRLAFRSKGQITVSDVVVETGLDLEEAEHLLESMVDHTHVRMEVRDDGSVLYEFPEIIRRLGSDE